MSGRATYHCYTDGACKAAHDGAGGWGFHIRPPRGEPIEGYGKQSGTLAKVMEYRAVAEALEALPAGASVVVYSDNQSLVENLSRQLGAWRARGFANVDSLIVACVRSIDAAIQARALDVQWRWIRSHGGNAGNERADALASQGAREAKAELARERRPKRSSG